jgi:hypothetical protein
MKRTTLLGMLTAFGLGLFSLHAQAQDSRARQADGHSVTDHELKNAELDIKLQELEHRITELAVEEGALELQKMELEMKQTALHVEMREIQAEMSRVQINKAQLRLRGMQERLHRDPQRETVRRESAERRRRPRETDEASGPDRVPRAVRELSSRIERLERMVRELARSSSEDE